MAFRSEAALGVILAALGASRLAAASDPTPEQKEIARALMDEGHARDDRGDHRAALESFLAADDAMHVPTTGLEVALQQSALGMLVEARDTALRILRMPTAPSDPPPFVTARERARTLAAQLSARIPTLVISVPNAPDLKNARIAIDGTPLPLAVLGVPFNVNPGRHVVSLVTDHAGPVEQATLVPENTVAHLDLVLPPRMAPVGEPADTESAAPVGEPSTPSSPLPPLLRWGGLGLAIAGLGVGTVTGVMTLSSTSSAKGDCPNGQCPASTWGDLHSARTTAAISDVAFVVAGVGAIAFVTSFFLPKPAEVTPPSAAASVPAHFTPWVSPLGAGVTGAF